MILGIIFAHVWGVLQLVALATLTRTVRVRTVLVAIAVGLYACAPAAILLQMTWTRFVARITGEQLFELVRVGSYTVDPCIEELVKVLPLVAVIAIIPAVRRQWSVADCILIGAATGSGFGLAEDLFRYSGAVNRTMSVDGGWQVAVNISLPIVPSPIKTLTSWLPSGAAIDDVPASFGHYNLHLIVSALGGLAIALIFLYGGHARRAGVALLLYIAGEHAAGNWTITGQSGLGSVLAAPFNAVRNFLWAMPIAALSIAWWLDRQRQRGAAVPELALARERRSKWHVLGMLSVAFARPPASILWIDGLTRLRRAYAAAAAIQPDTAQRLRQGIVISRDRIDRLLTGVKPATLSSEHGNRHSFSSFIRQPIVIAWLVLMLPAVVWVLGGFPQTAWLQSALKTPPGWAVVRGISFLGLVWIATQLMFGARRWRQITTAAIGDLAAVPILQLVTGVGALLFGSYAFLLSVMGGGPNGPVITNYHVLEAVASAALLGTLLTFVAALVLFPPLAGAAVAVTEAELLGAATTVAEAEGVATIGSQSTLLEIYGMRQLIASAAEGIEAEASQIAPNASRALDQADRLALQYGGDTSDWLKMTTKDWIMPSGVKVQIHYYLNALTNQIVELKWKIWP